MQISLLIKKVLVVGWLMMLAGPVLAQGLDTTNLKKVELENVDIAPAAFTSGWLLTNEDIQIELDGAVQNLYNAKHDKAEKQFRSLGRRYPHHPMPDFLLGLSTWWKILPSNTLNKQYDKVFYTYMDSAIAKGEKLYQADNKNYEACFFLAAAYSFSARLQAERHELRKATINSKRALDYLELSKEANGLSSEFLFGQALFNYYASWIALEHPFLRPVLLFFPKGNRQLGIQQLRNVADNAFYTSTEAKYFLLRILGSERENQPGAALAVAKDLVSRYPDNGPFAREYALLSFEQGKFRDCEKVSLDILDKLNQGYPGYEELSGRYATYYMGWIQQTKYKNRAKAKEYYQRCIVFSEMAELTKGGYYLYANLNLAKMAVDENNTLAARRYYQVVLDKADRSSTLYQEARDYLKQASRATSSATSKRAYSQAQ
ncbi:tetratricopeptide repeat protein [Hymenobacter taeanensis]|uniref:Tetratricopeptide repeat protein n=1 Tax=Hymenobacter taeanensis TaxID=2735321 RepID=A0A6M6BL15_9BACT|nr:MULTISPECIES: tetratricopeptide repeat protein [Hymenobacter]QJX47765.1 tetratricopeptide repeat protein [Hymenobacter taeanensis]UOQ82747.1 tetratricopeptide repeat protein [Hymenobacter sp. 5414T-23]